jgi:CheY-like chemotaxis protein
MQHTYFPVTLENLAAQVQYHDLLEGVFEIGDIQVSTQYLNHPALTLGYRLQADGVTVVFATDHEPHSRRLAVGAWEPLKGEDERHALFLENADLVIHDAQYTASEYPDKVGWGHSTVEYVVDTALGANVRRLVLFHHDPFRGDDALDQLVAAARARVSAAGGRLQVTAAAEGELLDVRPEAADVLRQPVVAPSARSEPEHVLAEQSVLLACSDPEVAAILAEAVGKGGLHLLQAEDANAALLLIRTQRPSMIILQHGLPSLPLPDLVGNIREEDAYGADVPVVVACNEEQRLSYGAELDAGVTDWLIKPFDSVYALARMRAWLLRTACRWVRAPRPGNEAQRVEALRRLDILDSPPEERFDRHTRIAAALFDVPIALISLLDSDRQWYKSHYGLTTDEVGREAAFCAHTILGEDPMIVPDACQDPRFADNPLVTGDPHMRFYAGVPLTLSDGSRVGTLCLVDRRPRDLDDQQRQLLRDLGQIVERELETLH